jgi:hypothetical protein
MPDDPVALEAQALSGRVCARSVGLAVPTEIQPDDGREAAGIDGLLDEAVAADGKARVPVSFGRDGDDAQALERRLASQTERHLVSIEARDVDVDEHQIRVDLDGAPNPFETVGRIDDLVPLRHEELSHEETIGRIVFDVKNA